ncbi:hypothetical protein PISMIDRAFT_453239 [Pisolithus microcarpus 441]|uniref:Uncharacterized protein n=1 Tax=Pisolithus microcarpus 441 TaxID=765257 RepID=A0A0C9YEL4_9AGAM|nr:hypothetical protein PISMIDRAFT_453239 [Pisolithus microcarpus 441]
MYSKCSEGRRTATTPHINTAVQPGTVYGICYHEDCMNKQDDKLPFEVVAFMMSRWFPYVRNGVIVPIRC